MRRPPGKGTWLKAEVGGANGMACSPSSPPRLWTSIRKKNGSRAAGAELPLLGSTGGREAADGGAQPNTRQTDIGRSLAMSCAWYDVT
jgi:hypothetical protein